MNLAPVYKLENWLLVERHWEGVTYLCLTGDVFGHPGYGQGEEVTTSALLARFDAVVATASGTKYYAGKPHPEASSQQHLNPFELRDHLMKRSGLLEVESLGELDAVVAEATGRRTPSAGQVPTIQIAHPSMLGATG